MKRNIYVYKKTPHCELEWKEKKLVGTLSTAPKKDKALQKTMNTMESNLTSKGQKYKFYWKRCFRSCVLEQCSNLQVMQIWIQNFISFLKVSLQILK